MSSRNQRRSNAHQSTYGSNDRTKRSDRSWGPASEGQYYQSRINPRTDEREYQYQQPSTPPSERNAIPRTDIASFTSTSSTMVDDGDCYDDGNQDFTYQSADGDSSTIDNITETSGLYSVASSDPTTNALDISPSMNRDHSPFDSTSPWSSSMYRGQSVFPSTSSSRGHSLNSYSTQTRTDSYSNRPGYISDQVSNTNAALSSMSIASPTLPARQTTFGGAEHDDLSGSVEDEIIYNYFRENESGRCGKSVMAQYLREQFTDLRPPLFAHYFSLNTEKRSVDALSFAKSIVVQILRKSLETTLPRLRKAADEIATYLQKLDNSSQLRFVTLRPVVCGALKRLQWYTLIVDALDECDDFGEPVMQMIDSLMAGPHALHGPKIIVLLRKSDTLTRICANTIAIAFDENSVMPDIKRFIAERVRQYPILKTIESEIIGKTKESCHGNFLWVSTMISSLLGHAKHKHARLKRLERIPDDLIQFYEQLVHEASRNKEEWELRLRREIFLLLLNPKRALTVDEVAIALQFRGTKRQPIEKRLEDVPKTIQRLCWPLVTIRDDRVLLVHTLVEDFLTQPLPDQVSRALSVHITRAESNATLARRCLQVLSEDQNRDPERISYWLYKNLYYEPNLPRALVQLSEDKDEDIVLYEYAAKYWTYHLTAVKEPTATLLDMASSFLHHYEFVMYSEYLYDYSSREISPISNVQAKLRSWLALLPPDSKKHLTLDDFFEEPYRELAEAYDQGNGSSILKYLCLFQLGNFYGLQAKPQPRYETLKEVAEGLEAILGREEPLVLRAKYMFAACLLPRREFTRALNLARTVSEIQKIVCGLERNDYWATLQLVAVLQFLMTDFVAATSTQSEVSKGLSGVPDARRFNVQMSDLFTGYIYEARGLLDDALLKYSMVERTQREALGEGNPSTLSAQVSMGSIYRQQGNLGEARKRLEHALAGWQVLFGETNSGVVDTTIQFIILDRETGEDWSRDAALARIDILEGNGSLNGEFQRYCQVRHLEALVLVDQGEFEEARLILQSLLDEQAQRGREANNRSLLWVRLTLATILREHEKKDEVPLLFEKLVTATGGGDVSPNYDRLDTPKELEMAERALRFIRQREQKKAEELLREHGLRWVREEDFWLISGTPSVDTAWMKGP
ncbi:hypothetical protein BKA65DRAFT_598695 [Rhexocercosporidium sp. MPI-PUGE-AT-0058]|nr:hypothetical protein BKA65DRAFT_598695 [Rhexocercosporidium sp. MPI-PUGE-AT-0058]